MSTGASYEFIDHPATHLDASLGAGYRRAQPQELVKSDAGEVIDLREVCAEKQYEFAFLGFPLKLRGATGSPLRPIAVPLRS